MNDKCDINGSGAECIKTESPTKVQEIDMIASESCGHCKAAKDLLKDKISSGRINVISEGSPQYHDLVNKFHIDGVPSFVVDKEKICRLDGDTDNPFLTCEDGSKIEF
jgi:glutaredoxin